MADFPQMISLVAPRVAMIFQLWMSTQIAHNVLLGWLKFFVLLFRSRQSAVKWSLLIFERERIPSTFDWRCSLLANLSSSGRKRYKTQLKFLQTFFFFFFPLVLLIFKSQKKSVRGEKQHNVLWACTFFFFLNHSHHHSPPSRVQVPPRQSNWMVAWLDGRSHFPPRWLTRLSWSHICEGKLIMQWGALKLVWFRSDGRRGASDLKWCDWLMTCWSVCWLRFASASFSRLVGLWVVVFLVWCCLGDDGDAAVNSAARSIFFSSSAPLAFPMGSSGECLRAAGLVQRVDPSDQSKTSNRGDVIGLLCSCPITLQFFKGSSSLELSSLWYSPHWTFDLVCLVRRRSRLWADFSSSSSRKLWSIEVVKCRNRFCGCLEFYDVAMMLFVQKTNKQ